MDQLHLEQRFNNHIYSRECPKYPFNHVIETGVGHYIEFDDTKGNESIHIFHKTGTFIEIDPDWKRSYQNSYGQCDNYCRW